MRNLILSFALAMTLVCGTVVLNYFFPANAVAVREIGDDLSTDNGLLCDMVFDSKGCLLSETTYRWDNGKDTKGDIVSLTVVYTHDVYAYNK
ncbi:MAG: hypothetical protein MJZ15_00820 [Bacteroidales bacterium]|nr:hypothetical protein [Bacteroidales bacterium]